MKAFGGISGKSCASAPCSPTYLPTPSALVWISKPSRATLVAWNFRKKLSQLIDRYSQWLSSEVQAGRLAPATRAYYLRQLGYFETKIGADRELPTLIPWDLEQDKRSWHYVQAVQRLFSWALDVELIERNPFRRVKLPCPGGRKRVLSRAELVTMLRLAGRPLRLVLQALRLAIARPQEVRALRWTDYRPDLRAFLLRDYKGKGRRHNAPEYRIIPVCDRFRRLLDRARRAAEGPTSHVFLNTHGRPWTANALLLAMRRLRRRAKLDVPGLERVVAYTLRHTAATAATANGCADRLLAEIMGHSSTRTTARYQHLQTSHLVEGIDRATRRRRA